MHPDLSPHLHTDKCNALIDQLHLCHEEPNTTTTMLPPPREGKIEDTVELDLKYPSVTERYWTKHYFIPKEKKPDTGKLVEVNERLLTKPKLVSERPDAEGYLAVILPPIKNGDGPLRRLISAQQYQELY